MGVRKGDARSLGYASYLHTSNPSSQNFLHLGLRVTGPGSFSIQVTTTKTHDYHGMAT